MSSSRTRSRIEIEPATPSLSLSEEVSHREHHAALAATLFVRSEAEEEVVFELEAGQLLLKDSLR